MAITQHRRVPDAAFVDDGLSPRRRQRGTALRLTSVVALIAAVVLVVLLGHRPRHSQPASVPTPEAASPGPSNGGAEPTPTEIAGVPLGYPDTKQGAQAAAANYAVAYGSDAMFNATRRHAIVSAIADPSVRAALQAQLDQSFAVVMSRFGLDADGNPPQGQSFVDRTVPVGVHLLTYTGEQAQVAVWTTGIVGLAGTGSTLPVAEAWGTTTITLHWVDGDWKWVAFAQSDGPTPVSGLQTPSNATDIADAVANYGGLPYAR